MLIAHASDLHSNLVPLWNIAPTVDAFVITGDFFPDLHTSFDKAKCAKFQEEWFKKKRQSIFKTLEGKPIITVDGNHDFVSLGEMLIKYGYPGEVHCITTPDKPIEFGGLLWTGYPHIPFTGGYWSKECEALEASQLAEQACLSWADVLVTHVPPAGIMANQYGCTSLRSYLDVHPHNFRYSFFGHVHERRGHMEKDGIKFYNSATIVQLVDVV